MKDIVRVKLENEMDLILAHKRAMKICELCGASLIVQTSFATAVSEIARGAIEFGKNATLSLSIESIANAKYLKAVVADSSDFSSKITDAANYAKRLVDGISIEKTLRDLRITLKQKLSSNVVLTEAKVQSFVDYFKLEPPLSPYDELRRKNIMLQELAEKLKESENDYKLLTDSLPLLMFSVNSRGQISYSNKWLQDFLGTTPKELNTGSWQTFLDPNDLPAFVKDLNNALQKQISLVGEYRIKEHKSQAFIWHLLTIIPLKNDKDVIQRWIGFVVDINAQKLIEQALKNNKELQKTQEALFSNQEELQRKVIELNRSNYELEQFAHLATHDLQEPLRKLFFITDSLKRKYAHLIDAPGLTMLDSMTRAAVRMKELITDLLSYSQLQQQEMVFEVVDLNGILTEIIKDFEFSIKEKNATIDLSTLPVIRGNSVRLRQLFSNLLSNSLKYSKPSVSPHITIGSHNTRHELVITVRDNGIGFDELYKERIFGLFERLHTKSEYPGTGIGLSICKRIVELHQGKISAASTLGEYAQFEITLPVSTEKATL